MASKYSLGYDDERFETTVNRNFHCLICYNVLKDPVTCQRNQHYFCRGCITEHLRRNSHTCPTCADELTVETLTEVPRIVTDYLDELNIRCDHYDRGCRELVQLQNLQRHVAECGFTLVVCENQGCNETISKRDRTYHESEQCQFRKLKCHNCGEISTMMAGMETKIEKLDTKLAHMSTEMAHVKTITANADTKLSEMDNKLNEMATKLRNTDVRMENVQRETSRMDAKITNIETKTERMGKQIANFPEKITAVNNEVKEIKVSINEVKDGFDHLKEAILEKIESKERKKEEMTRNERDTASGERKDQYIFVAGGWREKSVEIFNYRQREWSLLQPIPVNRWDASSFVYNNHVTVAGGDCGVFGSAQGTNMIQMKIHPVPDLSINWSNFGAKLPAKMHTHSSVVYKDSLFVTGGHLPYPDVFSDCIYEVRLQPPYTIKLVSQMPEPRIRHCTVLCDDSILIFGGKKSWTCKDNLSSVLRYDIKKNECQQLPELPYPVSAMAAVKCGENVMIIGGADKDDKALNNVIMYNIKTGNSHMLPSMLHKRRRCMAVVIGKTIIVLGGADEKSNSLKSVEGFSFERFSWEKLPDMKEERWCATAVVF